MIQTVEETVVPNPSPNPFDFSAGNPPSPDYITLTRPARKSSLLPAIVGLVLILLSCVILSGALGGWWALNRFGAHGGQPKLAAQAVLPLVKGDEAKAAK